jgi:hypothetical protein
MKHPNRDEWAPYVFGEAPAAEERRLQAHLESCEECAAEIAAWQRSLKMLDSWPVAPKPRARNIVAPVFRWAVAAAIVLAAGIAVGRMTAPSAESMRANVEASVRSAVAADLERALARSEARLAALGEENSRELLRTFSETLDAARTEDREAMVGLIQEQQRVAEERLVNWRRDLETLALQTDHGLRQARFTMTQLAARDGNN